MPDIKRIMALSEWLEYELEDTPEKIIDPPKIRLRVKYYNPMAGQDVPEGTTRISARIRESLIDAIRDWDLTEAGIPVPCTDEKKAELRPLLDALLSMMLKKEKDKPPAVLGTEILIFASDKGNFLKN